MVRGDHGVELAAHGADEDSVRRKWSGDVRLAGSRTQQLRILVAKSFTVSRVRVERTQRDPGFGDAEPVT
ncbi:MAG TPA: hypothetical protein VN797_09385 [Gemmatimonadaceae bacterium]|nr:hypothetical protein [Gemmatimonadaceae bacterium]